MVYINQTVTLLCRNNLSYTINFLFFQGKQLRKNTIITIYKITGGHLRPLPVNGFTDYAKEGTIMYKVVGYNTFQNNYLNNNVQNKKETDRTAKTDTSKKTDETKKTDKNMPKLSDKAKALLQDLKKQYGNMDFFVAEYETEEEAASYLSRGSKDYSVLIDPEELERMAEDEEVKKQNLALLDEAVGKLDTLKEELKETGKEDEVVSLGVSIGKDGKVSYFAELEKAGERQKEFVDKIREDKKEAAKEAAEKAADKGQDKYNYEHSKRTTVYADSAEELLKKITDVNWDEIKEQTSLPMPGGHFDFSI